MSVIHYFSQQCFAEVSPLCPSDSLVNKATSAVPAQFLPLKGLYQVNPKSQTVLALCFWIIFVNSLHIWLQSYCQTWKDFCITVLHWVQLEIGAGRRALANFKGAVVMCVPLSVLCASINWYRHLKITRTIKHSFPLPPNCFGKNECN